MSLLRCGNEIQGDEGCVFSVLCFPANFKVGLALSGAKFAFLSRLGTTSRAADSEGLFYAAFLFRHSALKRKTTR